MEKKEANEDDKIHAAQILSALSTGALMVKKCVVTCKGGLSILLSQCPDHSR